MSTVYKAERERERDTGGRTYTTVRRYRVPDREDDVVEKRELIVRKSSPTRSVRDDRSERHSDRESYRVDRREVDYRFVEREREYES